MQQHVSGKIVPKPNLELDLYRIKRTFYCALESTAIQNIERNLITQNLFILVLLGG